MTPRLAYLQLKLRNRGPFLLIGEDQMVIAVQNEPDPGAARVDRASLRLVAVRLQQLPDQESWQTGVEASSATRIARADHRVGGNHRVSTRSLCRAARVRTS